MNPARGQPASVLLANTSEENLAQMFAEFSDEPHAAPLARALVQARVRAPIATTTALARLVRGVISEPDADAAVRRAFQALRIAVNDEFGALDTFLRHLPDCLAPGGRVAILTFHSGEDRRVKQAFKAGTASDGCLCGHRGGSIATERRRGPRQSPREQREAALGAEGVRDGYYRLSQRASRFASGSKAMHPVVTNTEKYNQVSRLHDLTANGRSQWPPQWPPPCSRFP